MKYVIVALGMLLFCTPNVQAGPKTFDEGMQALLVEYLKIHAVFIEDSAKGVKGMAARLEKLAHAVPAVSGDAKHAKKLKKVPAKIAEAAAKMKGAKGLHDLRAAYKKVSRPMVLWATLTAPKGIKLVYCEMEKGGWLQKQKGVRNPYHGSEMLYCGQFIKTKK